MGRQRPPRRRGSAAMTAPRRLLHVFPSFAAGGAQMRMAALANHFGDRYAHTIIALDGDTSCRDRLDPALDVMCPAAPSMRHSLPVRLRAIAATIRAQNPDLLITSNWGSIEWAIANRLLVHARHIHSEDGFGRDERDRQIARRVLTRRLILRASIVIVPSRSLLNTASTIWRLPAQRLHYVPNGIDLTRFTPAAQRPTHPVIGCVAALRPEKNIARLIRACAIARRTHSFELVILGDGPERAALQANADSAGIAVNFLGARADPASVYRDFTAFALSSDTEQMPLSVMEAMASGLAVVTTDVGDIAGMVAPANRKFIVARDDQAIATALCGVLAEPNETVAIGEANRILAEKTFDFNEMARSWEALIDG
jgi:glycosyltransferase involved in cell wall biosynthesis